MGRMYSVNGYINATLRRSSKTLLVEGISDKLAIHRMAAELYPLSKESVTVDHAGMLEDTVLSGMGNKAKVLHIRDTADAMSSTLPRLQGVLASLVDREWDGLGFTSTTLDQCWTPPVQGTTSFVTLGHSIENYHFDIDCVIGYLKFGFPEHVSAELLTVIKARFSGILALATALSSVVKDGSCITRCYGLLEISHVRFQNDRCYLANQFGLACQDREISTAGTLVHDVNHIVDTNWDNLSTPGKSRWLMHGHVGNETLWVCVAHTAASLGVSAEIVEQIAHGYQKERQRFCIDWISKADVSMRIPLDQSVDWLHAVT